MRHSRSFATLAALAAMANPLPPGGTSADPAAGSRAQGILAPAVDEGPYRRPGRTERASVADDGSQGNSWSSPLAMSADGRFVAFASNSSNLVTGDTNGTFDVFVRDRQTGTTERISVASDGTQANGPSGFGYPAVSADGRFVAFVSDASNLVPIDVNQGDNAGSDIFVHDLLTGTTEIVSVASDGTQANAWSLNPALSADGRFVAFESPASTLVPGDTNGTTDIFVYDRQNRTTEMVSVASDGTLADNWSWFADISADGRYVAFQSEASNLVPAGTPITFTGSDVGQVFQIYVRDRLTGTTERVSVANDGTRGNGSSWEPSLGADGRYVAFRSTSSNLVAGDGNGRLNGTALPGWDIFVHDRATRTTERVSVTGDGAEPTLGIAAEPRISSDGRYVIFESTASNQVSGDTNGQRDIFVHDRLSGTTELVSIADNGAQGNADSGFDKAISADGRYVAFRSWASNLVPGDTNGEQDTFLQDRGPALGPGGLTATPTGAQVSVGGWATFSGVSLVSGMDPPDDGAPLAREKGGEIVRASLAYRPERADLLVRMDVDSMPSFRGPPMDGAVIQPGSMVPGIAGLPGCVTDSASRPLGGATKAGWSARTTRQAPSARYIAATRTAPRWRSSRAGLGRSETRWSWRSPCRPSA